MVPPPINWEATDHDLECVSELRQIAELTRALLWWRAIALWCCAALTFLIFGILGLICFCSGALAFLWRCCCQRRETGSAALRREVADLRARLPANANRLNDGRPRGVIVS